ncbi:MAG: arginine--tRNA ligase [Candidatus Dormibacteraceae bacterium]
MRLSVPVKEEIASALEGAVRELLPEGDLPDLELGRARNPDHGDYASPAGLKLAGILRRPPAEVAADLATRVRVPGRAASAEPAGGYVNFRLAPDWLRGLVGEVAATGSSYGSSRLGSGRRLQVEFVSINPTGPLHIGHGRGAILGDALASLLAFTGHEVEREYYVNDYGTQAQKFGASLLARLHGRQPPEGGYLGEYVTEIAEAARREIPGLAVMSPEVATDRLVEYGSERVLDMIRGSLEELGVRFDRWFSERSLWESGIAATAIERLERSGHLVRREGAVWFVPPADDAESPAEDRVVIRSDGLHTYLGSELGYLLDRFEQRGYDRVIEVWGADHYGYVPRFRQSMAALGLADDRMTIILHQMVNLKEGRMSKRAGRFVALSELVERVGKDAVRYFYLLRSPGAMMDFDLELATSQGNENPVYYAQYAHARLASVERFAAARELPTAADPSLIGEEWELDLARQVAVWPEAVDEAARLLEPHRIPYYVHDLADRVHAFYQAGNRDGRHRVVVDDAATTRARLELCRAARHTLRSALDLMGVSAPDQM